MVRRSLLAMLAASPVRAQCPSSTVIPLRIVDGFPVVDATIGGMPVSFLLDTGAQAHLILPEAQAALHLPLLPGTVPVIGTGGTREARVVRLDALRLGGVRLDPSPAPVAALPAPPRSSPMLAGLLGAPLLRQFDLELDAAAGRLGLFEAGRCPGDPSAAAIPLTITADGRALLPVQIDGHTVTALLDTGARATLLTETAAQRLGLRAPLSANTAQGVDGERLPVSHLLVGEMIVGADIRRRAPVSIAPLQLDGVDLLLGFDYLRQRRIWVSYVTARLLIAAPSPAPSEPRSPVPPRPGRARR